MQLHQSVMTPASIVLADHLLVVAQYAYSFEDDVLWIPALTERFFTYGIWAFLKKSMLQKS